MTTNEDDQGAQGAAAVESAEPVASAELSHDEALAVCYYCGCAQAMCLYYKIHGYIACCPECKHTPLPDRV